MAKGLSETLKERYRFDEWKHAGLEGEQLFVRNYRVQGDELPNRLVRTRVARLGAARRLNTSTWESLAAFGGRPVVVDVFEHPSREEAQEALLELTAEFHRPVELEGKTGDGGDVRVTTPDGAWFAFTRGNLLVRIVSGNGLTTPARTVAEQIDGALMSKPPAEVVTTEEDPRTLLAPAAPASFSAARARFPRAEAAAAELAEEDETPEEEKPFIKVFTKGAKVEAPEDMVITPDTTDMQVEVFEEEPGGQWRCRRYQASPTPQPEE